MNWYRITGVLSHKFEESFGQHPRVWLLSGIAIGLIFWHHAEAVAAKNRIAALCDVVERTDADLAEGPLPKRGEPLVWAADPLPKDKASLAVWGQRVADKSNIKAICR